MVAAIRSSVWMLLLLSLEPDEQEVAVNLGQMEIQRARRALDGCNATTAATAVAGEPGPRLTFASERASERASQRASLARLS